MRRGRVLCVVLLGLGACGAGSSTLDAQGLKLDYPSSFQTGKEVGAQPPGQVVGIVGAGRNDYIAVRARRGATLPLASLRASLPSIVAGVSPATIKMEHHSGQEMLTALQRPDPTSQARMYFFNADGRTWEIECRSTQARRDDVRSACAKALGSLRIG